MEPDIDKLTKILSNLNVEPSKGLFDKIYNRFNKKRKNRILILWFYIASGISLMFIGFYLFSIMNVQEKKKEQSTLINKNLDVKKSNKVEEDHCPVIENNIQIGLNATNQNVANTKSNRIATAQINDIINHQDKTLENKIFNSQIQNIDSLIQELNAHSSTSQTQSPEGRIASELLKPDTITNQNVSKNDNILDLLANRQMLFEIMTREFILPKILIAEKSPPIPPVLPTFMLDIFANSGTQHFCSYANANKMNYGLGLNYKMYKNIYVSLGISQSKIAYSYDFNTELFNRFGHTDKFPALPLINHRVQNISSEADYTSIDIGFKASVFNHRKHQVIAAIRQELIFSSKQLINYRLTDNGHYLSQTSNRSIRAHQFIPSVTYQYKFMKNLGVGIQVLHHYSLNYLGVEREWYSGFNFGGNITYGF